MSKKDFLRLNLDRAKEIHNVNAEDNSPKSSPSSPSALSKSVAFKSPRGRSKSKAKATRTISAEFALGEKDGSDGKFEDIVVSSPMPSDLLGDNKKLRNFFGVDDTGSPGTSPKGSPKLGRSESNLAVGTLDSPGKKKRASSANIGLSPPKKRPSIEADALPTSMTQRAMSSSGFAAVGESGASRRATVSVTASPSPLATMPFMTNNGSLEGYILTKTKKTGWKKIWIKTEGSSLLVFKERTEPKPTKQFDLKNATIKYGDQGDALTIQIALGDGKMLLFSAENDTSTTTWCNLFNEAITKITANQKHRKTTQIPIELLELFTDNSQCCDCSAEPADTTSVALGAFVCKDCATFHRALDPSISSFVVPSSAIDWSPAAIKWMSDVGNRAHNEFWEKEIPEGLTKPGPTSTLDEKRQWVLTKYVSRSMTGGAPIEESNKRIRPVQLPEQYVADEATLLTPRQKEFANSRSRSNDFNIPVLLDSARRKKLRGQKEFNISPASTPTGASNKTPPGGSSSGLVSGGGFEPFLRSADLLKEALLFMLQDGDFRRDLRTLLMDESKQQ